MATSSLCELLIKNHNSEKRKDVLGQLVVLHKGGSAYDRLHFLVFCEILLGCVSWSLFKELNLVSLCLGLASDKVPNVRLKLARIALKLWQGVDEAARDEIMETLNGLRNDKNKEIRVVSDKIYSYLKEHAAELLKDEALREQENALREAREKELERKEQVRHPQVSCRRRRRAKMRKARTTTPCSSLLRRICIKSRAKPALPASL